jgi:hypothetical protein
MAAAPLDWSMTIQLVQVCVKKIKSKGKQESNRLYVTQITR